MIADRRLYVDQRGRLVHELHPEAAMLLAAKGSEIEVDDVKRLDLRVWSDGRVMQGPEPEVVVPAEPLADVVQPAGAMEEPKPKRSYRRKG